MFLAADRGEVTQDEAKLLVGILLSAAADTTVMTLANAIRAFALFPEQYQLVRADPSLVRAAFEESLRWDSPSRMAGRITMRDVEIDGSRHSQGRALRPDVRAPPIAIRANGCIRSASTCDATIADIWAGARACMPASGRVLAGLEADALLGAVARHIESLRAGRRARALDDHHRSRSGETAGPIYGCRPRAPRGNGDER